MTDPKKAFFGFSNRADSERLHGPCDSREEAIEEARGYYGGVPVFVWPAAYPAATEFLPSAGEIVERMGEQAGDEHGDIAADGPNVTAEALSELDALLTAWAEKHVSWSYWMAVGDPERVEPESGVADE